MISDYFFDLYQWLQTSCNLSWSHAIYPKAMKPLVKLHNLSSHHTTSLYITQLKSRDFCPYVSQTSFKSCKEQPPDNLSKSDANSLSPAL